MVCVVCERVQRELPVIFLPTHHSHLDYVLISFVLFHYDIRAPHVAAGDNLLIPFFGSVSHASGWHTFYSLISMFLLGCCFFWWPFVKRFALCYRTIVCLSDCDVGVLWQMSCPGNVLSGKRLSGKVIVQETSVTRYSTPRLFGPCLLWRNGWMDQDATWYRDRPQPRPDCVWWVPKLPPVKRGTAAPHFLAHVYCAKRSSISATAELLFFLLPWSVARIAEASHKLFPLHSDLCCCVIIFGFGSWWT